jgi:hypothetical protein
MAVRPIVFDAAEDGSVGLTGQFDPLPDCMYCAKCYAFSH